MRKTIIGIILLTAISLLCRSEVTLQPLGNAPTIHVDGKPMLIIGGELGNSCASSEPDIAGTFAKCARMNLNTVLVPVYWDLIEPKEGKFDFTLPDAILREAKANGIKVVLLWFGAWKNSMSCYAPEWVKKDWKRFPRAKTSTGKPLEILSTFDENVFRADSTAFINLLTHLDHVDKDNTVLMVQVENEIGMLEDARDHSKQANAAFNTGVPKELIQNIPLPNMAVPGNSTAEKNLTWDKVFGESSSEADEAFMAWHYGRYVGRLAEAAKKVFKRPLYVNAAMNSRGRKPGEYPSAGPLAHLKDIWKTAAPDVDLLAPDIYDSGFTGWADKYAMPDNPLFIPEIRRSEDNPAQALYAFGEHDAIGFSPFSIENGSDEPDNRSVKGFAKLREWEPLLTQWRGKDMTRGVYFDMDSISTTLTMDADSLHLTASHFFTLPWDPRATDGSRWPAGGAVIARIAPLEYIIAGTGVVIKFEGHNEIADKRTLGEDGFLADGKTSPAEPSITNSQTSSPIADSQATSKRLRESPTTIERIGILSCDEVDTRMQRIRRLSGDETHQGRHVRISPDDFTILHVKLYRYQ